MMKKEQDYAEEAADADFKNLILANNPPLYKELFLKNPVDESNIEFLVPQSPGEVADVMAQLKEMGLDAKLDLNDNDFSNFDPKLPEPEPAPEDKHSDDSAGETDVRSALSNQDIE